MPTRKWILLLLLVILLLLCAWRFNPIDVVWLGDPDGPPYAVDYYVVLPGGVIGDKGAYDISRWVRGPDGREVMQERIHDLVEAEGLEQSVTALKDSKFSRWFSPNICSSGHNAPGSVARIVAEIRKDPRVEKLTHIAKEGSPEEKQRLREALRQELDLFVQPGAVWTGNGYADMWPQGPQQSVAIPLLLVETASDRDMLTTLVSAAMAYSELNPELYPSKAYPMVSLHTGDLSDTLEYAIDVCLWRLARQDGTALNSEEAALLASYREVHQEYVGAAISLLREIPPDWWLSQEPKEVVEARLDSLPILDLCDIVPGLGVTPAVAPEGIDWPCAPRNLNTCLLEFGKRLVAAQKAGRP